MTAGKARVALTTLLVLPLAATAWLSGRAAPPAPAAAGSPSRMVGPLNPPVIDTDGDGRAGAGDQTIGVARTGNQIVIDSPWDCGNDGAAKTINLSNPDGNGRFQTLSRTVGLRSMMQSIAITSFLPNGTPSGFRFFEYDSPDTRLGTGQLLDANDDGIIDGVSGLETDVHGVPLAGGNSFTVSLVQSDTNGDGNPDYLSIPWSQAAAVGVNTTDGCGPSGGDPQIWIPMADTNGDGVNDGIIPDLDGDGTADGDLFVARGVARPSGTAHYVGPNFPVLIDTNADGRPTPGSDSNIVPERVGNDVLLFTPWYDRLQDAHRLIMENPDGSGKFTSIRRNNGPLLQAVQFTGFAGGLPTGFAVTENGPRGLRSGNVQLVDRDGDGVVDGFVGIEDTAGGLAVSLSFITADTNSDGKPDYISIPWSQASAIGVNLDDGRGPGQGGTDPQIWIPLADTNGDGAGDTVGFDFNGDGIPDPELWNGPLVGVGAPPAFTPSGRMVGPLSPPLIDTNGDGRPSQGDTPIGLARSGNTVTITSPWDCVTGDGDNVIRFTQPDSSGRFRTAARTSVAGTQSLDLTAFSSNGFPSAFAFTQRGARQRTGTGTLLDANHDGIVDGVQGNETTSGLGTPGLNFSISLIQVDTDADGNPDYISIPWSQASTVGVDTTDQCGPGGRDPQVWLPMADTDGDGYNDGIVPDLDGDNVADADLFRGGSIARPNGTTRFVGPNYPILVDTSGDGRPTPGLDFPVVPERAGSLLYLNTPWNVNPAAGSHIITLEDPNNTGKFSHARRTNGSLVQQIDINAFATIACAPVVNGPPCTGTTPVGLDVTQTGGRNRSGSLRLVDRNGDGVYEGITGAEVGGDGLEVSMSFVHADADGDGKPDYISIPWSQASAMGVNTRDTIGPSGVDPQLWVPLADTNGDGVGDAVVLDLNGDGVPDADFYSTPAVAGGTTRYTMAEGASNGFFDTWMLLANPTAAATTANVTYLKDSGAPVTQSVAVPAFSRVTVFADAIAGLAPSAFGLRVDAPASVPLGVERSMFYDVQYFGGHTEAATTSTDTRWMFAEGCQRGFDTYFLLMNPGSSAAQATLTFLLEGGQPPITRTVTVPATSRVNFMTGGVPELVGQAFSTIVDADQPIVAERSMFFSGYTASHESMGSRMASPYWYHTEGAIGPFFDTFLLMLNPNTQPAAVTVTVRPVSGSAVTRNLTIPARSRGTYWLDVDLEPAVSGSLSITVTADRPIVSERSMYWGGPPGQWTEGHNSVGETDPGTRWVLAEGAVGGPVNFDTYLLLGNPGGTAAAVSLTFLRQGGAPVVKTVNVPANGRVDYSVNSLVPEIAGESFSVIAEATNGVPIAVERSMYWTPPGASFWAGGSNAVARRLP